MKNKCYLLNTLLAAVLFAALLAAVLVRTFAPAVILPGLELPNLVLLSLTALVADHYLAPGARRCWLGIFLLSALSFGLLPWASGFVTPLEALMLSLKGGGVFTAVTWLFGSMTQRISTGPAAPAAPAVSALGLYLAAQCLMGIL